MRHRRGDRVDGERGAVGRSDRSRRLRPRHLEGVRAWLRPVYAWAVSRAREGGRVDLHSKMTRADGGVVAFELKLNVRWCCCSSRRLGVDRRVRSIVIVTVPVSSAAEPVGHRVAEGVRAAVVVGVRRVGRARTGPLLSVPWSARSVIGVRQGALSPSDAAQGDARRRADRRAPSPSGCRTSAVRSLVSVIVSSCWRRMLSGSRPSRRCRLRARHDRVDQPGVGRCVSTVWTGCRPAGVSADAAAA